VTEESLAFERLHRLTGRGYVARFGQRMPSGGILLQHPGEGPDLVLLPSGTIESMEPRHAQAGTELAIPREDQTGFDRFVERLPQRRKRRRGRKFLYFLLFVAVWLFSIFLTVVFLSD
jgi:predicted nucleic acid-binding Zn ribbon protein